MAGELWSYLASMSNSRDAKKRQEEAYKQDSLQRKEQREFDLARDKSRQQHEYDKLFTADALNEDAEKRQSSSAKDLAKYQEELKSLYAEKRAHEAATASTLKFYADKGIPPEQAASVYDKALSSFKAEMEKTEQDARTGKLKADIVEEGLSKTRKSSIDSLVTKSDAEAEEDKFRFGQQTDPKNQDLRKAAHASGWMKDVGVASNLFTKELPPGSLVVRPEMQNAYINKIAPPFTAGGQTTTKTPTFTNIGGQQFQTGEKVNVNPGYYNEAIRGNINALPPAAAQAPAAGQGVANPRIDTLQRPPSDLMGTNLEESLLKQLMGREDLMKQFTTPLSPEQERLRLLRLQEEQFNKTGIRNLLSNPNQIRNY